jgi:hypothetical protein
MSASAPIDEPPVLGRLRGHFGTDPGVLPILTHTFAGYDHANLQRAVDEWTAAHSRTREVLGVVSPNRMYQRLTLSTLVANNALAEHVSFGPVEYETVDIGTGEPISCLTSGLLLLTDGESRLAALVQGPTMHRRFDPGVVVEVLAANREDAERFLHELRSTVRSKNVYRGRIVSLGVDDHRQLKIDFHRLPSVTRDNIILPAGVLERIELHTIRFSERLEKLKAAGRHLKRGLLLHGPPGTGKTFTAMYLASQMPGRTVLLVTGRGQGLIEQTCAMARVLEPATIILEDVDLIGVARGHEQGPCVSPLMFELLNQMDGLAEDCDILFLLTTNRPDILEPALASRPGRVDQAIEVPLPDAECRRRLIELYSRGLNLRVADLGPLVRRTEGASAAFIKELLRRATLFAADSREDLSVTERELDEALHDLVLRRDDLTKSLLGFQSSPGPPA